MAQKWKKEKDSYLATFQKFIKSILKSILKIPLGKAVFWVATTMDDSSKQTILRSLQPWKCWCDGFASSSKQSQSRAFEDNILSAIRIYQILVQYGKKPYICSMKTVFGDNVKNAPQGQ